MYGYSTRLEDRAEDHPPEILSPSVRQYGGMIRQNADLRGIRRTYIYSCTLSQRKVLMLTASDMLRDEMAHPAAPSGPSFAIESPGTWASQQLPWSPGDSAPGCYTASF